MSESRVKGQLTRFRPQVVLLLLTKSQLQLCQSQRSAVSQLDSSCAGCCRGRREGGQTSFIPLLAKTRWRQDLQIARNVLVNIHKQPPDLAPASVFCGGATRSKHLPGEGGGRTKAVSSCHSSPAGGSPGPT